MTLLKSLGLSVALLLCASTSLYAGKPIFTCPDLANKDKIELGEMTQGQDGWFFRVAADLKDDFDLMPETSKYLTRLHDELAERGTQLIFLSVPPRGIAASDYLDTAQPVQGSYDEKDVEKVYRQMLDKLRATGIIVPDLIDSARSMQQGKTPFFFSRDHHWTPFGAKTSAAAIAAALKDNAKYKELKRATYETKQTGTNEWAVTMAHEIQRLCTSDIPAEPYPQFATRLVSTGAGGTGEDALFGDTSSGDPAVLIGSSFSALPNFNFDGFISEATGLDVANYAISGGELFNALVSLSSSPDFQKLHPPFLIWEAPGIYDLNQNSTQFFRQILPAIHGDCTGENILATGTLEVKEGKGGLLMNVDESKKVTGQKYYVALESSNRGLAKFTLQLDYADGDGEWFLVDRSDHSNNTGHFYVELDDEIGSVLKQVSIDKLSNVNTTLKATLCRVPQPKK